jgi:hypothetical protein
MGRRSDIDWLAVQADVRLGALGIRQIAKKHGIAESNLRNKAQREGWERGDGAAVRAAAIEADAAVAAARAKEIGAEIGAEQVRLYEAGLRKATLTAVEVAAEHQAAARKGMELAVDLLAELQLASQIKDLIGIEAQSCREDDAARAAAIDRLLGVRGRAETLDRLAGALAKLTAVEREAHDMNKVDQPNDMDQFLLRMHEDRELKARQAKDLVGRGLQ